MFTLPVFIFNTFFIFKQKHKTETEIQIIEYFTHVPFVKIFNAEKAKIEFLYTTISENIETVSRNTSTHKSVTLMECPINNSCQADIQGI